MVSNPPPALWVSARRRIELLPHFKISDTLSKIALSQYTCNPPNNTAIVIMYQRNHPHPGLYVLSNPFPMTYDASDMNLHDMYAHPSIRNAKKDSTNATCEEVSTRGSIEDSRVDAVDGGVRDDEGWTWKNSNMHRKMLLNSHTPPKYTFSLFFPPTDAHADGKDRGRGDARGCEVWGFGRMMYGRVKNRIRFVPFQRTHQLSSLPA